MAAANSVPATPRGQEAAAVFKAVDADSDGSLTLSEMQMKLSDFGVEDNQIEQLFYAMDVNHDGRVSLDEFIAGYRQVLVFRSMDTDGNCEVSLKEAFAGEAKAVKAGGGATDEFDPDAIARTFSAMDTDESGTISLAEFVSATSTVGARWAADLWRKSLCVFHGPQQLECRTLPSSSVDACQGHAHLGWLCRRQGGGPVVGSRSATRRSQETPRRHWHPP